MADNTAFSGKNSSILIGRESAYGTPVACSLDLGYIQGGNIEQSEDKEEIGSIGALNDQQHVRIRYRVKGSINAVYQHGRILEFALGSATTAGASDPYTHTMTEADVIAAFTLQATKNFTSTSRKTTIAGCRINSLRLTAEKGAALKWSADFVGKTAAMTSATAAQTLDDIVPPVPSQIAVYTGTDAGNPTDELTGVQSFEVTINNNLEDLESLNSVLISESISQQRKYSGKITIAESLATETAKQLNLILGTTVATAPATTQDKRAIKLYWTNGLTPADTLTLTLYGCTFDSMTEPYDKSGITYVDLPFKALRLGACTSQDDIPSASW